MLHRASVNTEVPVTNYMEYRPWEANCRSARQEISLLLWNPNVYYRVHKSPQIRGTV